MGLTEKQLEEHYNGIGGSLAPAVVGVDPYKTTYQAYEEMTDPTSREDISDKEQVIFGNVLEDPIAKEFARRKGFKIQRVNITRRHKDYPFMLAHPDRIVVGKREGLEIKNRSYFKGAEYGADDTDQVLDSELVQCMHYMAVLDYERWHLGVLIGGQQLRMFTIERDDELIRTLVDIESDFWSRVKTRTPPTPTTSEDMIKAWPGHAGELIVATPDIECLVEDLRDRKAEKTRLEKEIKGMELELKKFMGDAVGVCIDDTRNKPIATWKPQTTTRLDQEAVKAMLGDELHLYQTTSKTRVLRLSK